MEDFIVPPVKEEQPLVPSDEAAKTAFYAAATYGQDNPIQNYFSAKTDLETTGRSAFVDMANQAWQKEQDVTIKDTVKSIIEDETIDPLQKRTILNNYALTGFISKDIKDKYIQQTAARDVGVTVSDKEAQDAVIDTLNQRKSVQKRQIEISNTQDMLSNLVERFKSNKANLSFTDTIDSIGLVASDFLVSALGGVAKLTSLMAGEPLEKATALQKYTVDRYTEKANTEGAQKAREWLISQLEPLGAFNKKIYEDTKAFGLKSGLSPEKAEIHAMLSSIVEDPLTWIGVGSIHDVSKGTPKIHPDSPLATTEVANPAVAKEAAVETLKDTTGKTEEAIGADKGTIIHDWVLPKPITKADYGKLSPDLQEELQKLANLDTQVRDVFQETRYDPNIINATQREEEVARLLSVIREQKGPYYQQANSMIVETPTGFEGKAILGRNSYSGYKREIDAKKALEKYNTSLQILPEEERGVTSLVNQFGSWYIQHTWKKEYDLAAGRIFGPDSIQASILGMDVSGLARSSVGKWIFPTGWLPNWVEAGAARGIERSARLENILLQPLRDKVVTTPFGKELNVLISEGEKLGKDYFSPVEISTKFPHLSTKQVEDLFITHIYQRRLQDYTWNFVNRLERNRLAADAMQGIYDASGNYLGAGTEHFPESAKEGIKEVWNFEKRAPEEYTNQRIVKLDSPVEDAAGNRLNFATLDDVNTKLDLLPQEVLTRVAGYSPRSIKEHFFVDVIPKELGIDGVLQKNLETLRHYKQTKAAASTKSEAIALQKELESIYPNHIVEVRPERTENYGTILTDYKVFSEYLRHSMRRGEPLPSLNRVANIEDRVVTNVKSIQSLSRLSLLSQWETAFKKAYVKGFGEFLDRGEFPQLKTDIRAKGDLSLERKKSFDAAHRLYDWYANQKTFATMGDFIWKKSLHNIADILEKLKIPSKLLRDIGNKGNLLVKVPKLIASHLYISLSPLRQHLIQPIQMAEMWAINPQTAVQNMNLFLLVRMHLAAEAKSMVKYKGIFQYLAERGNELSKFVSPEDFKAIVAGIKSSGMLQSVDLNSIVHGVFRDVERGLSESSWSEAAKNTLEVTKFPVKLAKAVGFDAAELSNRIGVWLQTRDMWIKKNPEKDWKTKESLEEISHEAWKISGSMTRPGNLPYQQGALSIIFQFAAINQKMLMNLLQDKATIMTPLQKAKLSAIRLTLYGAKYGIPGGSVLYYFLERSNDPTMKENAELVKRGVTDYVANKLIAAHVDPDTPSDLAVSRMLTPYSEGFLPYLDVGYQIWKTAAGDKVQMPRFPVASVASKFYQTFENMSGWWTTRDVTGDPDTFKQMAYEAAEMASGLNSWAKGQLIVGMHDKVSKSGNLLGNQYSMAEAYALMYAGIQSEKDSITWDVVSLMSDKNKNLDQTAKDIYNQMVNMRTKIGESDWDTFGRRLSSYMSMLDPKYFNEFDKHALMDKIINLDRNHYLTVKQSIFADVWKKNATDMTQDRQLILDRLGQSTDPETRRFVKMIKNGDL